MEIFCHIEPFGCSCCDHAVKNGCIYPDKRVTILRFVRALKQNTPQTTIDSAPSDTEYWDVCLKSPTLKHHCLAPPQFLRRRLKEEYITKEEFARRYHCILDANLTEAIILVNDTYRRGIRTVYLLSYSEEETASLQEWLRRINS